MTRKHFEAIAAILAANSDRSGTAAETWRVQCIADDLADLFGQSNPRFDRQRFLAASHVLNSYSGGQNV